MSSAVLAYDLDVALMHRLLTLDREHAAQQRAVESSGPFTQLDAVLAGRGPKVNDQGFAYEDPNETYRLAMAEREGLVH